MALFKPTALRHRATDITPQFLKELGARAVLLDIDNTIAPYSSHEPAEDMVNWAKGLVKAGLRVVVVSNNYERRVGPFAARLGLEHISFALKPLPSGYIRARKMLGMRSRDCVIIGDQIFTDVVGANLCGMGSILLEPLEPEDGFSFKLRRYFERGLREKYKREDV